MDGFMKYPRVSPQLDLRKKLTPEDIKSIRAKHKTGVSFSELGRQYGVTRTAIKYHVVPEFHDRIIETQKNTRQFYRYHTDPEYRKLHIQRVQARQSYRYHTDSEYRKIYIQRVRASQSKRLKNENSLA
jgi:hypothetical protein